MSYIGGECNGGGDMKCDDRCSSFVSDVRAPNPDPLTCICTHRINHHKDGRTVASFSSSSSSTLVRPPVPATMSGEMYGFVEDVRVKCKFEISNPQSGVCFDAILLIDDGAMSEITLPARKVIQLGLEPYGKPLRTKGSNNVTDHVYTLVPQVMVKGIFTRDGQPEEVSAVLEVKVHKREYDAAVAEAASSASKKRARSPSQTGTPKGKQKTRREMQSSSSSSVPELSSSSFSSSSPPVIKLSPVRHRGDPAREDRVVIGARGAFKLGFKVVKQCCLELEEVELEED